MAIYQGKIKEHYLNPLHTNPINPVTHSAKVSNLSCGDEVEVFITVENQIIKSISHQSEGCAIVIATASILSDYLIGKNITEISELNLKRLTDMIEFKVGPAREGCVLITLEAIQDALAS